MLAQRRLVPLLVVFALVLLATVPPAQTQQNPPKAGDLELVQKVSAARREYQRSLEQLYLHYRQVNDKERERWAKEELVNFHRIPQNAYILDLDVPPPNLNGHTNVPEANKYLSYTYRPPYKLPVAS